MQGPSSLSAIYLRYEFTLVILYIYLYKLKQYLFLHTVELESNNLEYF